MTVLTDNDPPPWSVLNPEGQAPIVLTGDHAGRHIPAALENLGLADEERERHIAYDIGILAVIEELCRILDARACVCNISRLVADPNRVPDDPTLMRAISDGTVIPGNLRLDARQRQERLGEIYWPYLEASTRLIEDTERALGTQVMVLAMHSFTPVYRGVQRVWPLALLSHHDRRITEPLLAALRAELDEPVGDNQPYSGHADYDQGLKLHTVAAGRPGVAVEVRQDLLATQEGVRHWAGVLGRALQSLPEV